MSLAPETWPTPLLNTIRTSNKYLLNPLMLRLAGRKNWYAAAIEHTGRRSGKVYTTPIVAERIDGGFVIPLPYGTAVDWLQNVRAAGARRSPPRARNTKWCGPRSSTRGGPALVSPRRRRTFERVGIEGFLKVKDQPST